jgi:hypothetical protein
MKGFGSSSSSRTRNGVHGGVTGQMSDDATSKAGVDGSITRRSGRRILLSNRWGQQVQSPRDIEMQYSYSSSRNVDQFVRKNPYFLMYNRDVYLVPELHIEAHVPRCSAL